MRNRHPFSLVEIMIALLLLAVAGGMAILKIRESVQERRVHATCDVVRGTVELAARLAKITHGEVKVVVTEVNGKWLLFIDNDIKLSTHLKTTFSQKRLLEGVTDAKVSTPHYKVRSGVFSFFPWGLSDPETKLDLLFETGKQATCPLGEYIAQAEQESDTDAKEAYPYEVLQDEQEVQEKTTQVHVD